MTQIVKTHHALEKLIDNKIPFVIVTLVDHNGSIPQELGAKVVFTESGLFFGTIGGGNIENYCYQLAMKQLKDGIPIPKSLLNLNLQRDLSMTCGGEVSLFFEYESFKKNFKIVIFGAGHVSQQLCRVLQTLDCNITCIDSREEWINRLPIGDYLNKVVCDYPENFVKTIDTDSFIVIMTRGHTTDLPILEEVLKRMERDQFVFPYVGMMGSKSKRFAMEKDLKERGVRKDLLDYFTSPLGMNFGKNTPEEIAISVTAQLLEVRDKACTIPN